MTAGGSSCLIKQNISTDGKNWRVDGSTTAPSQGDEEVFVFYSKR